MPTEPLRIVTTYGFEPEEIRRIRDAAAVPVEILICAGRAEFRERLPEADAVFGDLRGDELPLAQRLRWFHAGAAGLDDLDPAVFEGDFTITNFAGTFAPAIAETAMGMLLALTRGISRYYVPQFLRREWKPVGTVRSPDHTEISGRIMGIAGMGGIGRAVGRAAHYGFGMRIIGTDERTGGKPEFVSELRDPSWLPEMAAQADVLVAAAPLTRATRWMFDESIFRRMKETAIFLALSRGKLFDDMALVKALKEGWIAGAGLDVMPQEPPPSEHPIYDLPNVVMTMHTSGWGPGRQARLISLYAENVRRFAAGEPLLNVVDKSKRY
ncbi:MAG: D-2-hydroxyacid dehydrogenase [Bryobacterales bacterium]|nr:D-2-hydroxyacid dehydrogenase [Bryobacterales bacterium]